MSAALDLGTGQMIYRIGQRKRRRDLLSFLKLLRRRWHGQKLYVVMDNFSPAQASQDNGLGGPPLTTSSWFSCGPTPPG